MELLGIFMALLLTTFVGGYFTILLAWVAAFYEDGKYFLAALAMLLLTLYLDYYIIVSNITIVVTPNQPIH